MRIESLGSFPHFNQGRKLLRFFVSFTATAGHVPYDRSTLKGKNLFPFGNKFFPI